MNYERIKMKTYNIIPIGTEVIANGEFKGIIISINIRKNSITYEVQKNNRYRDYNLLVQ